MNERLARSVSAMSLAYPQLAFGTEAATGIEAGVWRGIVQPVQSLVRLGEILDDIAHERVVRVVAGEVRHLPECRAEHCHHHWMDRLVFWRTRFQIDVRWDGSNADPRCWVISPPVWTLDKKKHVWGDGSICPFMSSEAWDANRDDVVNFMAHAAVWLVKWMLWDQTDVWIGAEHAFSPEHHLASVQPTNRCWCRSGRQYASCHLVSDRAAAAGRRAQIAEILDQSRQRKSPNAT